MHCTPAAAQQITELKNNTYTMTDSYYDKLQCLYQTEQPLVLDARPEHLYLQQRLAGAANLPLHNLTPRCYLLPDKTTPFVVVVPSDTDYVVTADQSKHGSAAQGTCTTVYLKGAASLEEFLSSRGWTAVSCYFHDVPELWAAARQLSVLEEGLQADSEQLSRRCLFAPSGLLAASIDAVEAALMDQIQQRQLQQHLPGDRHVLRALDVGCGSGRDVAWLASRQPAVAAAAVQACTTPCTPQQQAGGVQQPLQCAAANHSQPPMQSRSCHLQWQVTGVDEWLGALERAADLAHDMKLTCDNVRLAYARICGETGDFQPLQVPQKSRLSRSSLAADISEQQHGNSSSGVASHSVVFLGKFDLVLCCRFLVRALLPKLREMLNPGGFIVYSTFLDLPGVRAFGRPAGPDHLLQPGELAGQHFGPEQGFVVLRDEVVCTSDGREVSWFVARKECL